MKWPTFSMVGRIRPEAGDTKEPENGIAWELEALAPRGTFITADVQVQVNVEDKGRREDVTWALKDLQSINQSPTEWRLSLNGPEVKHPEK